MNHEGHEVSRRPWFRGFLRVPPSCASVSFVVKVVRLTATGLWLPLRKFRHLSGMRFRMPASGRFRTPSEPSPVPIKEPPDAPENPDVPVREPDPDPAEPGQI